MAEERLEPTSGISEVDWLTINGGKPKYTNVRRDQHGIPTVDIVHPGSGEPVATYNPLGYPMIALLVHNTVPPHRINIRTCDLRRFHGDPCDRRSQQFKGDRQPR